MAPPPIEAQINVRPADWVSRVRAYQSQQSPHPIDLKLDANEGPAPQDTGSFTNAPLNVYPDTGPLEARLAEIHGVDPSQVLVTNGGDDAIDRTCRVFLQPGRNLILPEPTFTMIRQYATIAGGEVRSVSWFDRDFPLAEIREASDANTTLVAFVSPNNPTGSTISVDEVRAVAEDVPQAALLIDQAYAEFENERTRDQQLTEVALRELPHAIVVRTFSKSFGLAGLRMGYALGQPELIDWLRRAGSPYPVAGPALEIAMEALHG
ncbi:MAG: histidinol-phosphate transaminase, partial [Planctomycetota bacterium]